MGKKKQIIAVLLILLALQTVNQYASFALGFTAMWWVIDAIVLFSMFKARKSFYTKNTLLYWPVFFYLTWNVSCILRGIFVAENYWEWKHLLRTSFVLLLPLSIYVSTNRLIMQRIYIQYIKYLLPLFFIFILVMHQGAYGRYLMPISFLLVFLPLLVRKWRLIIVVFSFVGMFASLADRSNVIKFAVPFLLGLLYFLRPLVSVLLLRVGRLIFIVLPIALFLLALSGQFNVFRISDYVEGDFATENKAEGKQEDLKSDTRTPLYVEVISSALKNDYVWMGRTPARGNDSKLFGKKIEALTGTGKLERFSNEVSILNIFTYTGLIGVLLYFLVFLKATYLALFRSKSWFVKIAGVYLSFRWSYGWVEDFSAFSFSYVFLWLFIGFCYSPNFRAMTDLEFKYWVRGIFDVRYRRATLIKTKLNTILS